MGANQEFGKGNLKTNDQVRWMQLQSDNEICKLCSENCKLSHTRTSLLILSKTTFGSL
jgi:hypothetical protein